MTLHTVVSGSGERSVLLVHGMMGSSESWWRVTEALAERGFRVVAVDLPGHGLSSSDHSASVESIARELAATAHSAGPAPYALAVGHSFGGLVLAAATPLIATDRFVFIDSPFTARGGYDVEETRREYEADRHGRTAERLRSRPDFSERDVEVEARAAELFDPVTAAAVAAGPGGQWLPPAGSLVIRTDISDYVTPDVAEALRDSLVEVVTVHGAGHTVWRTHFEEFWSALSIS